MRSLWLKVFVIGGLVFALMVPLLLVRSLVLERQNRAREVVDEIAQSSSRSQILTGPFLAVDVEGIVPTSRTISENGQQRTVTETRRDVTMLPIPPAALHIDGDLRTERRSRGIFSAVLYHGVIRASGTLPIPSVPLPGIAAEHQKITGARVVVGLGDARGIEKIQMRLGGRELVVEPGTRVAGLQEGVHAPVPADLLQAANAEFSVDLDLTGTESIAVVPLGGANDVAFRSDWPHPGFTGSALPTKHEIGPSGFQASWKISRLSSQAQQRLSDCGASAETCPNMFASAFQARLVDPVDRYLKTERAVKYSLVFLSLVFGAVFFIEVLRKVRVHPMQYGLTGLAVGMFFLLLLSLAEHLGFGKAYLIAAFACAALISAYMMGVLRSRLGGIGFGGLVAGLYGLLYGVLQSEDYALLMGTLTLFALLAFVMIATRWFDWYGEGGSTTG